MNIFIRIFATISFVVLFYTYLSAQNPQDENSDGSRGDALVIKLVTIGPGDDMTSWWGHTAIIVEDNKFNVSRFYNYGLFSFEQDDFITNFVMGRLIFWVGAWNTSDALAHYVSLNREIRFQILRSFSRKTSGDCNLSG